MSPELSEIPVESEGLFVFRPNDSLVETLDKIFKDEGVGPYRRWRIRRYINSLNLEQRYEFEAGVTKILVESGCSFPVGAISNGVLVQDWTSFIQMLIDNLPKILDFIAKLIPLFVLLTLLLCLFLFAGTANAQCSGGVCRPVKSTVVKTKEIVQEKQPVRRVTKQAVRRPRLLIRRLINR